MIFSFLLFSILIIILVFCILILIKYQEQEEDYEQVDCSKYGASDCDNAKGPNGERLGCAYTGAECVYMG
jgi:hypothetical protein